MSHHFIVGCVGKPSAGKSTFFNAVTDATAKVGNYPFTTIEPNEGIAHYLTSCPCQKYNVECKPRYGSCNNGQRRVPIKLLDVAGLIPGASEGRGLGNKFLDDLRHANVLLHILDVSGQTNEKGEATVGYDPSADHDWLVMEIFLWVFNNLWKKWPNVARAHNAKNSTLVETLVSQLSGYGAKEALLEDVVYDLGVKDPVDLTSWQQPDVEKLVKTFVARRFPLILVLNKADQKGETDKNIVKICERYGGQNVVVCSAMAECFLRKMTAQKFIDYDPNTGDVKALKELDEKIATRVDNLNAMVLFRHGSTGVQNAINKAVEREGLIPVFPVKNIKTFGSDKGSSAFPECMLVPRGTTIKQFAKMLHQEIYRNFSGAEGANGCLLGENDELTEERNIVRFVTTRYESQS
eukprot:Selendium_serpulae@DN3968_c0_g1_i2.p1